ncbi:peptidase inhibitor family I36 protein [Streptomyces sp. NPDC057273]|uniref:peptidase inhibitor family I36 protein n=1 Tax=unclassified Streptomyces TaxID=2593676 RepID=UPI0036351DE6
MRRDGRGQFSARGLPGKVDHAEPLAGTALVNAMPAAAVGGCDAGQLCLYRSTQFRTIGLETTRTNACWKLLDYGLTDPWNGISSYVNNQRVSATLYRYDQEWWITGHIWDGTFSSDSTSNWSFRKSHYVCTGNATPWS